MAMERPAQAGAPADIVVAPASSSTAKTEAAVKTTMMLIIFSVPFE